MHNMPSIQLILEIGKNRLPGLNELDLLFKDLKSSKTPLEAEKIKKKIEKQMEKVFGCPFEIDLHYIGPFADNCGVIPILKSYGTIEKEETSVKLGSVRRVYIILGMALVNQCTPREITSIFLHEIGHIVNHISSTLSTLHDWMLKFNILFSTLNAIPVINVAVLPLYIITSRTLFFTQHVGEYHADKFAVEYGYGDELISVIHKWNLEENHEDNKTTFWRFLSVLKSLIMGQTHPTHKDRIKKLVEEIKKNYAGQYKNKRIEKILDEYYS